MSKRWNYQTVEVKPGMMGYVKSDNLQAELARQGQLGWELVHILFAPFHPALLVFKREA